MGGGMGPGRAGGNAIGPPCVLRRNVLSACADAEAKFWSLTKQRPVTILLDSTKKY
jgi:hypothetical protein